VPRPAGNGVEVGRLFVRLGLTAFGGPVAHIALFRDEFVRRRGWLGDREFLDLLAVASLIPGPTSTELAMHIGHRRAGWPGFLLAGLAFLLPAALIVLGLAWAYVEYGSLPEVGAAFAGIAPVVVAIVAHATVVLGRAALTTAPARVIAAWAVAASWLGVPPVAVLLAGGAAALLWTGVARGGPAVALWLGALAPAASAGAAAGLGLLGLGGVFVRVGLLLFGSGFVLVALLDSELVATGILTRRELLDAVAVGQLTPGPVITTATWIGYLLLGLPGGVVATVAIAAPAFAFAALSVPVLHRLRGWARARAALDGVAAAVVGTLAVAAAQLAGTAIVDGLTAVLAAGSFAALLATRVNPAALIALGAMAGVAGSWLVG
jgi:chromate transporter